MRYVIGLILFLCLGVHLMAQNIVYADKVYRHEIKTVRFYNQKKEGSFPVIELRSTDQLLLSFDDLTGQSRRFSYTIEHCDAQWNPSRLSPTEYLQSFTEDRITDYRYSSATKQKYIHYELRLPNQNIIPKISGNYLLKVYEDGNPDNVYLTRRMYIVDPRVNTLADVKASPTTTLRQTNQKIDLVVDYGRLQVQNPYADIKAFIMQNARPQTGMLNTRPSYVRGTQLIYNDVNTNDFPGRNEFRYFDTRSLLLNSERIGHIYRDTANTVMLLTDYNRNKPDYTFQYDNDGKFFIINQDGRDARIDADYAHMYFSLAANKTDKDGAAYLVGSFNDYTINATSKLDYDNTAGRFYTNMLLKQGVYDYLYVWVDARNSNVDDIALEGAYFETENDYQILVYYHPPGARWDELVGYRLLNTGTNK